MKHILSCITLLLAIPMLSGAAPAQSFDSPQTRMRPIGSPSIVDQFRRDAPSAGSHRVPRPTTSSVRQAAWMQGGGMNLPDNLAPPPVAAPSPSTPANPLPPSSAPRSLPANPPPMESAPLAPAPQSNSDYAPLVQPRLGDDFATLDNSCHVSGPSSYTAASAPGCCAPVSYQAPPAPIAPPATIPGPSVPLSTAPATVLPPTAIVPGRATGAPAGALISFGQEQYPVQVGQGLFGQPVAYVPGQTCRNWLRYLFP